MYSVSRIKNTCGPSTAFYRNSFRYFALVVFCLVVGLGNVNASVEEDEWELIDGKWTVKNPPAGSRYGDGDYFEFVTDGNKIKRFCLKVKDGKLIKFKLVKNKTGHAIRVGNKIILSFSFLAKGGGESERHDATFVFDYEDYELNKFADFVFSIEGHDHEGSEKHGVIGDGGGGIGITHAHGKGGGTGG